MPITQASRSVLGQRRVAFHVKGWSMTLPVPARGDDMEERHRQ